jgi:hypothetical protein
MVVALPFRYDLWSSTEPVREEDSIDVHCLIPNGNLIVLNVRSKTTLFELKEVRITERKRVNHALVKNNIQCVIDVFSECYRTFFRLFHVQLFLKLELFVYVRAV